MKLDNNIDSKSSSLNILSANQNEKKKKTFIVSGCNFNFMQNEPASGVFFVRGNSDVFVELTDCKFNGKLAKDSHYIDGEIISNKSPKMVVKNCQFESGESNAITLDSDYLSIDMKQQMFGSLVEKKLSKESTKNALAVVISAAFLVAALATVGFVLISLRRKKNTLSEENEMSSEASSAEVENGI